jgi:hypothetical protein
MNVIKLVLKFGTRSVRILGRIIRLECTDLETSGYFLKYHFSKRLDQGQFVNKNTCQNSISKMYPADCVFRFTTTLFDHHTSEQKSVDSREKQYCNVSQLISLFFVVPAQKGQIVKSALIKLNVQIFGPARATVYPFPGLCRRLSCLYSTVL